ncbi:MAG: hypothetical protein HOH13_05845 [Crocinitomicaceae bacterium]|nr:hypothetical protein [Crocinitomicaceae bacterium]
MILFISILICGCLFGLHLIFLLEKKKPGSDQYVHIHFIKATKKVKHRYLHQIPGWLFGNFSGYPLLYHQMLSFFSKKGLKKFQKISSWLYFTVYLGLFVLGYFILVPTQYFSNSKNATQILLIVAMTLSSPLFFNRSDARNSGISARSFGMIFGLLYTFVLAKQLHGDDLDWLPLLLGIVCVYFSFLASQFTLQFILFVSIFYAVINLNCMPLLNIAGGLALFVGIHYKIAKAFFSFQIEHKKNFIRFNPFLKKSYGLWSYFKKQFWTELSWSRNKKKPLFILRNTNSVLHLVMGATMVPVAVGIEIYNWWHGRTTPLGVIAMATLITFFATSFRRTRFLGEPERYLTFVVFTSSICVVLTLPIWWSIAIIFVLLSRMLAMSFTDIKTPADDQSDSHFEEIKKAVNELAENEEVRVGSNNMSISKKLISLKYETFYGWMFSLYHYNPYQFFKENNWPTLEEEFFIKFVHDYQLNYLVIDRGSFVGELTDSKLKFTFIQASGLLTLYKVVSK